MNFGHILPNVISFCF